MLKLDFRFATRLVALPFLLAVLSSAVACKDGGDGDRDYGSGGTFVIDSSGGAATLGGSSGGSAGSIFIGVEYDGGSAVVIDDGGSVDTSWDASATEFDAGGAVLLVVSADLTVLLDPVMPPDGDVYQIANDSDLYVSDGDADLGDEDRVEALDVRSGATLTLPLTDDFGGEAVLTIPGPVRNEGVITTVDQSPTARGSFDLECDRYFGRGDILTHGVLPGQAGGDIIVSAELGGFGGGDWLSYGAAHSDGRGGDGGEIEYESEQGLFSGNIEHVGRFVTAGGDGSEAGGDAGEIVIESYFSVLCTCDIDTTGGDGPDDLGEGGNVRVRAIYDGEVIIGGDISTGGGDGETGDGGDAGNITLIASGGSLRMSGSIHAMGGSVTGLDGEAGVGGHVSIGTRPNSTPADPFDADVPAGDILMSGSILSMGGAGMGDGASAGRGGGILVSVDNWFSLGDQRVEMLGIMSITSRGGDATDSPGHGGGAHVTATGSDSATRGTIDLEPTIDTSGGSVTADVPASDGGDGGDILIEAPTINRSGELIADGGTGLSPGDDGFIFETSGLP